MHLCVVYGNCWILVHTQWFMDGGQWKFPCGRHNCNWQLFYIGIKIVIAVMDWKKVQCQNVLYGRQDSVGYSGLLLSKKVFILFTGCIFIL